MKRRLEHIDQSIERYLGQIASADRQEAAIMKKAVRRYPPMVTFPIPTALESGA